VATALEDALDERDDLYVQLTAAQTRLKRRPKKQELLLKVDALDTELKALVRGAAYRQTTQEARELVALFPEFLIQFAHLDPLFGTRAQGLPIYELSAFEEIIPLASGRHTIVRARLSGAAENDWCVLKQFAAEDERRLRRELSALTVLHPNIIRVLGVCREHGGSSRWWLQLPWYPFNLREWSSQHRNAQESFEDVMERVVPVLRGVLDAVHMLHQVK
jgi:hypothetical protein